MSNKHFLLSVMVCSLSIIPVRSQDMPEPDGPGNPPPPGLVVPIDENAHLLAAAGIVLGVVVLKKKRR